MQYNPKTHHRQSLRLPAYDYSQNGIYFLTICSYKHKCLFGEIINNAMLLNEFGKIVQKEWLRSLQIRMEICLDEFVIMPNHLHGIVVIEQERGDRPVAPTIGSFVSGFKASVTKKINDVRRTPKIPVWQRNYYDHIIRHEDSLEKIREYISSNPHNWKDDKYFR